MSDFLEYYKKTEQANAITEEEKLALHKKHKLIAAQRHKLEDDDDFYKDDVSINEGNRIYKKPVRMPQSTPRPIVKPQVDPMPTSKPIQRPVPRPLLQEEPDDFNMPIPKQINPVRDPFDNVSDIPVQRKKKFQPIAEPTNPALKEAYSMMDEMQKKIETMFYRYGMAGLEKINECMEDVFEDIVNPRPVPEIKYIEKPAAPVKQKRKITKKPTTITETTTTETKTKKITAMSPEKLQQAFEDINNSLDITQVAAVATKTENTPTESIAESTLKKVQANAMMLEKSMNKKNEKPVEETDENYVQPEEFDIVDDDVIDDPVAEAKNYNDIDATVLDEHTANTTDINDIPSDEKE